MGHDDHGVLERQQEFLEPQDRLDVEVIGRLVEQQDIRFTEDSLCQQHADLVAVVEILDQHAVT